MDSKIMIVDDDKEFLEELNETLKANNYKVVLVSESSKVLGLVCSEKPDLILMDIRMPGKSGFQLAKEIKHDYKISPIPIIAMSAYLQEDDSPLMEMCGIGSRLEKPFTPLDVITRIENALQGNK